MRHLVICFTLYGILSFSSFARASENLYGIGNPWNGLGELGVGWCRAGAGATAFDWPAMAPDPNTINFKSPDDELKNWLEPHGINFIGLLGYTPDWASSAPESVKDKRAYPPKDLRAWSNYVEKTAAYFGDRIQYYEVWNEEDIGFWKGTCNQYCDLLKSGYLAAKKGNPNCVVIFGGLAGVNLPFIRECYEHGAKDYFDAMAVHPYQWGDEFNDEWFCGQLRDLRQLMLSNGDDKEIFLTEFGWESKGTPESEDIQARLLMQSLITCLMLRDEVRLAAACPFTSRDWGGPGYGFIRHDDSRKPAWNAFSTLIKLTANAKYVGTLPVKSPVRGYLFDVGEAGTAPKRLAILWSSNKESHEVEVKLDTPKCTKITMLGKTEEIELDRDGVLKLSVGPQPVYLSFQGSTEIQSAKKFETKTVVAQPLPERMPVWMSLDIPDKTRRLFGTRGKKLTYGVNIHNDSERTQEIRIDYELTNSELSKPVRGRACAEIPACSEKRVELEIRIPKEATPELSDLKLTALVDRCPIPLLEEKVRITDGWAVEFLANSWIDEKYLVDAGDSGGAPSVRFGGKYWTYMFNLTRANSAEIALNVGAHEDGFWRVSASRDNRNWETILEGRSNRDWRQADISDYAGDPVFIRIEGDDQRRQQLGEIVLTASD